jgi:hypothetical protein
MRRGRLRLDGFRRQLLRVKAFRRRDMLGALPMATESFFATCPRGLELVLERELEACGGRAVRQIGGGGHFEGALATCYRANLHSRVASRILCASMI